MLPGFGVVVPTEMGPSGQAEWVGTSAYNFYWTVPTGVTSICVLAIGRGGKSTGAGGGGGGNLAYKNDIAVTPGEQLRVCLSPRSGGEQGECSAMILRGATVLCGARAGGDASGYPGGTPNTTGNVGDVVNYGGAGGGGSDGYGGGGGGGAAGYSGAGGEGGSLAA